MSEQKLTLRQRAEMALQNENMIRFLNTLSYAEGTEKHGYHTNFGGSRLEDLSWHPNKVLGRTKDGVTTATGRYQFLGSTFNEQAKKLGLKDFGPNSQNLAAVGLIIQNGALDDVLKGDVTKAVYKLRNVWASLPDNPSKNQPHKTHAEIIAAWNKYGGNADPSFIHPSSNMYHMNGQQYDYSTTNPQPIASIQSPMQSTQGNREEWLGQQPQKAETQQNNPLSAFTDHFNQLNNTLNAFQPQETPIDNQTKYQKELAAAFGVEPSTKGIIPDYIGDMVRSIYDAQA
ncbi:glycoside hydrolase family 24 protein [Ursidibacter arcticus]